MKILATVMTLFLTGILFFILAVCQVFSGILINCGKYGWTVDLIGFFSGIFLIAMGLGILQGKYQIFNC